MNDFRGKIKDECKVVSSRWAYGSLAKASGRVFIVLPDAEFSETQYGDDAIEGIIEVCPETVSPHVRNDKHGNAVYAGDKIRYVCGPCTAQKGEVHAGVVSWEQDEMAFMVTVPNYDATALLCFMEDIELIESGEDNG